MSKDKADQRKKYPVDGVRFVALRRAKAHSQDTLAKAAELSVENIGRLERGSESYIFAKTFRKLAAALNMELHEFAAAIAPIAADESAADSTEEVIRMLRQPGKQAIAHRFGTDLSDELSAISRASSLEELRTAALKLADRIAGVLKDADGTPASLRISENHRPQPPHDPQPAPLRTRG